MRMILIFVFFDVKSVNGCVIKEMVWWDYIFEV